MSKKRKIKEDFVLQESLGHHWERLLESGDNADILLCVKGEDGDEILKVSLWNVVKQLYYEVFFIIYK